MIHGIGTDICNTRRVAAVWLRQGERFVEKVLGPNEQREWRARADRHPERALQFLATRFAAKEAFCKALGTGFRHPMRWHDCEVVSRSGGQPGLDLHNELKAWVESRGLRVHLSLSDDTDYATAFVVVETAS